ncbi:thiopurine S-methyltransferase-like [Penaeus monodon]|uniref:thiopurine S-methyltransferase-like n=1 Tax=Penaeus monodon TaxID=6687 RepID=UPI0018A7C8B1|nr:thiopurine S-methyltransferase-like [Penaeus monodon]
MRAVHRLLLRVLALSRYSSPEMSEINRLDTWNERWEKGRTGWHKAEVNFALKNHGKTLLPTPGRRVLLPLCGKSVDLKWCYDEGHHVVGIEGVEKPVVDFFIEHNIPYSVDQLSWAKLYKSGDSRLQLYCCDLFSIDVEAIGKFDSVFDRGSLVAIYEDDRERYAELMKSILSSDFRYLVNLTQYTPTENFNGPPRNVPTALVQKLFGDKISIEVLETLDRTEEDPKVKGTWGLDSMFEVVALLTPKE